MDMGTKGVAMARTLHRLTDKIIRNLAAPGYHADGGGLYLQISKAGTKSWVFRFTLRRRTRDMGLGSAQAVSLTEARATAGECRTLIAIRADAQTEREKATRDAAETIDKAKIAAEQIVSAAKDERTAIEAEIRAEVSRNVDAILKRKTG